ncbi:MAG: carboxypeptidase-like regulatory domain-containing protein [Pirellulales bacterium]
MLLAGCGGDSFDVAPVSGTVTLDGQPLPEARVAFEPIAPAGELLAGPGSHGKTDAAGRYTLETLEGRRGAVIGRHRVTISTAVAAPPGSANEFKSIEERVPQRYLDGGEPLEFTVPAGGTEAADFSLTK